MVSFWYGKGRRVPKRDRTAGRSAAGNQEGSKLRRIGNRFIHQQNRNIVAHRIHPPTLAALQAFSGFLELKRFLAHGADQNVQQILRNHGSILRLLPGTAHAVGNPNLHTKHLGAARARTPAPHILILATSFCSRSETPNPVIDHWLGVERPH